MHILFLSSWFPHPPDNGARMRTWNLLRQMARHHEIALLSFVQNEPRQDDLDAVSSFCRVLGTVTQRRFRPSRPRAILRLLSPQPRAVLEMYHPQMAKLIHQAIHQHSFDLIIASEIGPGVSAAPYLMDLDSLPRVIEDLELSMIWNQLQMQSSWSGRIRHSLTWWKQKRYAVRLLHSVEGCTVASEQEGALLRRLSPDFEPLSVVPNGLDLELYAGDWGAPETGTLVFSGALTYQANFDAMAFFLQDIWPLIRSAQPGVTLRITGRTDGVPLAQLPLTEGVILTGYLKDIRPTIAKSQICVVPLLTGGGTRLKILEAMALGTPVVATSRGAEGLEAVPGTHLIIADEPAGFAAAVLSLLVDERLRAKLTAHGRQLVQECYSWERCAHQLEELLRKAVVQRQKGHD
ncbi:MAG: glycosyltransferase family 4 protein [Chloroflexota bacterium]